MNVKKRNYTIRLVCFYVMLRFLKFKFINVLHSNQKRIWDTFQVKLIFFKKKMA